MDSATPAFFRPRMTTDHRFLFFTLPNRSIPLNLEEFTKILLNMPPMCIEMILPPSKI